MLKVAFRYSVLRKKASNIQSQPHVEIEKESGNIKTRKKPNKIILDCQTSLFVNNQPGSSHR